MSAHASASACQLACDPQRCLCGGSALDLSLGRPAGGVTGRLPGTPAQQRWSQLEQQPSGVVLWAMQQPQHEQKAVRSQPMSLGPQCSRPRWVGALGLPSMRLPLLHQHLGEAAWLCDPEHLQWTAAHPQRTLQCQYCPPVHCGWPLVRQQCCAMLGGGSQPLLERKWNLGLGGQKTVSPLILAALCAPVLLA